MAWFVPPCDTHPANLQSLLYKKHIFNIFFKKYLTMSKKSSTFAPKLKKQLLTI